VEEKKKICSHIVVVVVVSSQELLPQMAFSREQLLQPEPPTLQAEH
jgi:hypothetical protein